MGPPDGARRVAEASAMNTTTRPDWLRLWIGEDTRKRLVEPLMRIARSDMDQETRTRLASAVFAEWKDEVRLRFPVESDVTTAR